MSEGLQKTCPHCGDLSPPARAVCLGCGHWLIEPQRLSRRERRRWRKDARRLNSRRPEGDAARAERLARETAEWDAHPWNQRKETP